MAKNTQKGKSNEEAYATYRHYVERVNRDVATRKKLEENNRKFQKKSIVLILLAGPWVGRYSRRMAAIHRWNVDGLDPLLADTEAKEILVARHRAHNATYGMPKEFTAEQIDTLHKSRTFSPTDVASLTEIPSYGPSFISLWTDAKNRGLSDDDAGSSIYDWQYYTPPAWARDDEGKRRSYR